MFIVRGPSAVQAFGLESPSWGTFVAPLWLQWLAVLVYIVGFLLADGECNVVCNRRVGHVHFK